MGVCAGRLKCLAFLAVAFDVPNDCQWHHSRPVRASLPKLDCVVARRGRNFTFLDSIPAKAEAFRFVTYKLYLRVDGIIRRNARMFCSVKDTGFAIVRHRCY